MKLINKERYFLIRYSKILDDLPILRSSDKTMRRLMAELERKNVLKRFVKGNRDLYVCVNWKKLFDQEEDGQNCPAIINIGGQTDQKDGETLDNSVQPPRQERPAIENYNNKKIKIIVNARVSEQEKDLVVREIHKQLAPNISTVTRDLFFKSFIITDIANTFIEFEFPSRFAAENARKENFLREYESATQKAVKLFSK